MSDRTPVAQLLHARHLVGRFAESLRRTDPPQDAEATLVELLNGGESALYWAMSRADRRHAVECASRAQTLLRSEPEAADGWSEAEIMVASAMHDVGKTVAGLGTLSRAVAALAEGEAPADGRGHRDGERLSWSQRLWVHRDHPTLGARQLEAAGSSGLAVAWAREHHEPVADWTCSERLGRLLAEADGEPRPA